MASNFGPIVGKIKADTSDFNKKITASAKKTETFSQKAGKSIKGIGKSITSAKSAFVAFGAAIASAAIINAVDKVLTKLDLIGKTADKIGLSTERLQELQFAAQQTGVSTTTLNMSMQRFARRLGEAQTGTGELKDTLKQYGIEVKNADGSMRSIDDVFNDYVNTIANASSDQEALRLAFKGFDSEGAALVNTFRDGVAGLQAFGDEARELGIILDDDLIRGAEEARSKVDALKKSITLKFAAVIAANTDQIVILVDGLVDLVNWAAKATQAWVDLKAAFTDDFTKASTDARRAQIDMLVREREALKNLQVSLGKSRVDKTDEIALIQKEIEAKNEQIRAIQDLFEAEEKARNAKKNRQPDEEPGGAGGTIPETEAERAKREKGAADAEKERAKRVKEVLADLDKTNDLLDTIFEKDDKRLKVALDIQDPISRQKDQLREILDLMEKFPEQADALAESYRVVAEEAAGIVAGLEETDETTKNLNVSLAEMGATFTSAFEDAIVNGGDLGDIFQGLIKDIIRMTIRALILQPLLDALGSRGGILGKIFGGGSAGGGILQQGQVQLVGERGPELIVPNAPARVLNNHMLTQGAGGGGGNITVEIVNRGTPQQAVSSTSSMSPEGAVVSIVTEDIRKNGPIATSFQQTFGSRRIA